MDEYAESFKKATIEFFSKLDNDNVNSIEMVYGFAKGLYFLQQKQKGGAANEKSKR